METACRRPGLAVVRGPINQAGIDESPTPLACVHFHQHVGVWIVAGGCHHVVLRAEGVRKVDPFMPVTGDYQLNCVLVPAQQRMKAVVLNLGRSAGPQRKVSKDEGWLAGGQLLLKPLELWLAE